MNGTAQEASILKGIASVAALVAALAAGDLSRYAAAEPALFSRLLGIHGRTLPPRRLGFDGTLRLAWRLVASAA